MKGFQITNPISITINNSYRVEKWEEAWIKKCIIDNPACNKMEIAAKLGIHVRTLSRKAIQYNIDLSKAGRQKLKTYN